jgi:hypothetical protein
MVASTDRVASSVGVCDHVGCAARRYKSPPPFSGRKTANLANFGGGNQQLRSGGIALICASEFARRYFGQGKAAGRAEGRVEIILKLLTTRYGALSAAVEAHVRAGGSTELDRIAERVLTALTVEEALGIPCA